MTTARSPSAHTGVRTGRPRLSSGPTKRRCAPPMSAGSSPGSRSTPMSVTSAPAGTSEAPPAASAEPTGRRHAAIMGQSNPLNRQRIACEKTRMSRLRGGSMRGGAAPPSGLSPPEWPSASKIFSSRPTSSRSSPLRLPATPRTPTRGCGSSSTRTIRRSPWRSCRRDRCPNRHPPLTAPRTRRSISLIGHRVR
jgi:hypothetical protein